MSSLLRLHFPSQASVIFYILYREICIGMQYIPKSMWCLKTLSFATKNRYIVFVLPQKRLKKYGVQLNTFFIR